MQPTNPTSLSPSPTGGCLGVHPIHFERFSAPVVLPGWLAELAVGQTAPCKSLFAVGWLGRSAARWGASAGRVR